MIQAAMIMANAMTSIIEQNYQQTNFAGYVIHRDGTVTRAGKKIATELRPRRGGGHDITIKLTVDKKRKKFTLGRLVCECFHGPLHGLEVNHLDRNPLNCHADNVEPATKSENQRHWRGL